jgi:hypothetical protein
MDGQSVEQFDYFVDSSPKIAEVKLGGVWKTLLIIGQGYGGTFYSALDVTAAGMGVAPDADGLSAVNAMLSKFDTANETIQFSWAFPKYSSFDPDIFFTQALSDGFPGNQVTLYGDLKSTATQVENASGSRSPTRPLVRSSMTVRSRPSLPVPDTSRTSRRRWSIAAVRRPAGRCSCWMRPRACRSTIRAAVALAWAVMTPAT